MLNQNVLLSAEMLNMLNVLGGARRRPQTKIIQHIQHFSRKNVIFQKLSFFQGKCWICRILGGLLNKNVLLSGEMLNMLNVLGKAWGPPPLCLLALPPKIQHIQHFPWKKHIFSKNASFSWNVEYVEFWGACWIKMCFFLQKCWICWICWMFWGKPGDPPPLSSSSPPKKFNIFNISPERSTFSQKNASFRGNVEYVEFWGACWIKMCFFQGKCWICWICWMFWGEPGDPPPYLLVLPKTFNIFNIFNISAERSTFWFNMGPQNSTYSTFPLKEAHFLKKMLLSAEMLNMLNSLARGHLLISPKTFNIFNIFNISAERSTFWFNMGPQNSTYSTFPLKERHFSENVLLSAEMLNMLNSLARGHLLISPKTFNIFNIFNISAERSTFWFNMGPQNSTYSTFPLKEAFFWENVLLSGEMLNMLNFLAMYVWMGDVQWESGYLIHKRY